MSRHAATLIWTAFLAAILVAGPFDRLLAQDRGPPAEETMVLEEAPDEPLPIEEGLIPQVPVAGEPREEAPSLRGPEAVLPPPPRVEEQVKVGETGEGENRWNINITSAILMNYVFNNAPDSFTVKYRLEIKGQANAATAVIKGEADINADVQGALAKWPTGECKLEVTVAKVPFELTFNRAGEEKGSLKLVFKKAINEDWASKCTFTDAPGAKFDTRGSPETWLAKALEKARPPLKDLVADIGTEEKTTTFVISKEQINDAPVGSGEIEGTGVITIKPGGE